MKELSIEEKAQRYDEALARANEMIKDMTNIGGVAKVDDIQYIFPELKESGDIRKRIIDALHGDVLEMSEIKDATTWLEKQGNLMKALQISNAKIGELIEENYYLKEQLEKQSEHTNFLNKIQIGDKVTRNEDGVLVNLSQLNRVAKKQDGQKPAGKVEPKFKVGDTVIVKPMSCHGKVFKGEPFMIIDIIEDNYVSDDGKTYSISLQDGWELVEQKPAWSEEDEKEVAVLEAYIRSRDWSERHIDRALGIVDELVKKLKSLRPQNHWKPSDEQIEALEHFVRSIGESGYSSPYDNNTKLLYLLLEQLKKLREE